MLGYSLSGKARTCGDQCEITQGKFTFTQNILGSNRTISELF